MPGPWQELELCQLSFPSLRVFKHNIQLLWPAILIRDSQHEQWIFGRYCRTIGADTDDVTFSGRYSLISARTGI